MLDENVQLYQDALQKMHISPDDFIRTTDQKRHWPVAQEVWRRMQENGDIYKKSYTGNYCEGCELFLTEKDIDENGNCIHHHVPPKEVQEENYFFRLSKFADSLTQQIQSDEIHIHPVFRKNEMLAFIDAGLEDVSFSRRADTMPWGIPVPDDDEHVMYVWCDALTNYLTGAGFLQDDALFEKFNPAYVHIIGKDISRFHCLFYMAMLESAGLPRSQNILVHGFVTSGGNRLSKTLGNILDPIEMSQKYGSDAVKFFIATASGVGKDIDYTEEWFHAMYTDLLANNYGNFVNRVITLCQKFEV